MDAPRTLSPESALVVAAGLYVGKPYPDPVTAAARLREAVLALENQVLGGELGALHEAAELHLAGQAVKPTALSDALGAYCAAHAQAQRPSQRPSQRRSASRAPIPVGATHAHHSAPEDDPL